MKIHYYEYEYDPYLVIAAIITCLLGTYTTMNLLQNIRYSNNLKSLIFMVVLSSFSLSILSVWSFHFLLIYSLKFKEAQIYLDLQITFLSMLVAIILNAVGFCFSFLPFLNRTMKKYQEELDKQISCDKKIDKPEPSNIKPEKGNTLASSVLKRSRFFTTLGKKAVNKAFETIVRKSNVEIDDVLEKNYEYSQYATFFEKEKLVRRDYIFIIIGVLLIGPSTMLLHVVGMYALKIEGVVDFSSHTQIAITIIGVIACLVINFAFFYKDNSY
jgi:NO-binding membrane sensor protein with MHYT domain